MDELRACWFKVIDAYKYHWKPGKFHQWGFENGEVEPYVYSVAIVEDDHGRIHTPTPEWVNFGKDEPI